VAFIAFYGLVDLPGTVFTVRDDFFAGSDVVVMMLAEGVVCARD